MSDRKPVFDALRAFRGSGFSQAEVGDIDAFLDKFEGKPATPPDNGRFPGELIAGAMKAEQIYPVPASVSLAQWALESGYGKSVSGKWNYGGITAKVKGAVFPYQPGSPLEPATLCWTHEQYQGQRVKCQRWFKDFESAEAFFEAHAKLLGTSPVYARARAKLPDVDAYVDQLEPIYGPGGKVVSPGYATDPNYAETLKSIMRSNNLYQYNRGQA